MYKQTGMRKLRPMASRDIYQSSQIVLNIQIYGPWGGEQGDNRVKYGLALNADLQP